MTDQEQVKEVVSGTEVDNVNTDYLAAIKELKENSVSKEEYERIKADNKRLLDNFVNGEIVSTEAIELRPSIQELRKKLFNGNANISNIEYISTALELRDALMEAGEPDPFLPQGKNIAPTNEDIEEANKAAQIFRECIDMAEGDNAVFTNELQRRTVEAFPMKAKKK